MGLAQLAAEFEDTYDYEDQFLSQIDDEEDYESLLAQLEADVEEKDNEIT